MNALFRSSLLRLALVLACLTGSLAAQTTSFTYQGKLTDGGASASGPYDLQFKLYDAAANGNQIGAMLTRAAVTVTNGVFSTTLDFGAAAFPGAARWLEISVRPANNGAYTTLTPRQPINSTPYAIRSLSAETVTGPVPASQITGTLPPGSLPGGGSYINNATTQQAASNFNISGDGTAGGTLSGNVVNTATQYNLGGQRVLSVTGENTSTGFQAGTALSTGYSNSFFGNAAGKQTNTGYFNAFFGAFAGSSNRSGAENAFFGGSAGSNNVSGSQNAYFGFLAGGFSQTGQQNSAFGHAAGLNANGVGNSIFGFEAGTSTGDAHYNSFFGYRAGQSTSNNQDPVKGNSNAFFGALAGQANRSGYTNAFFGASAGEANTDGYSNAFFGAFAGRVFRDPQGAGNTLLGAAAGQNLVSGGSNTLVGLATGNMLTTGNNNTLVGANANVGQPGLSFATAIGAGANVSDSNTLVLGRSVDTVAVYGRFSITRLRAQSGAQQQLCVNDQAYVVWCSSSQRYKTNVQPLRSGLAVVNRLRPVTFDWKSNGAPDLGFIAEEVAAVEPLLAFRNANGQIEGVNYNQVSAVLVNAVKEQQAQIEAQQKQLKQQQATIARLEQQQAALAQLKQLLCAAQPQAAACQR